MNLIDFLASLEPGQASSNRLTAIGHAHSATVSPTCSRRSFLQALTSVAIPIGGDHGRIKPSIPVPATDLLRHDGARTTLAALTAGHVTAVQLMFTTCSTVCPIQAALFSRVQTLLPTMRTSGLQLLSISVDPEDDNVKALSEWRHHYNAGPEWIVAAPSPKDTGQIQSFFGQSKASYAAHSTQVNIVDRQGRLVWRTNELPDPGEIASILKKV